MAGSMDEAAAASIDPAVSTAYLAAVLDALGDQSAAAVCYCRTSPDARASCEVVFRASRGLRAVELCVDLTVQLLTPADALAAELSRGVEAAFSRRSADRRGSAARAARGRAAGPARSGSPS